MAKVWKRCRRGNCVFKDGKGTSLTLPEPRRAKEKKEKRSDNLVYDAFSDPLRAACRGNTCECFIVVQRVDKDNNIEVEALYAGDGDKAPYTVGNETIGPLTKTEVDFYQKLQSEDPTRTFEFTYACIEIKIGDDGKHQPVRK